MRSIIQSLSVASALLMQGVALADTRGVSDGNISPPASWQISLPAAVTPTVVVRKHVPILFGGITAVAPLPVQGFTATRQSEGVYQLTWPEYEAISSYKIERLSADKEAPANSTQVLTRWEEVVNSSERSLLQLHNLGSLDLNGHQTYRLSACVDAVCQVVDQLSYHVSGDELTNTIPQNTTLTELQTSSARSAPAQKGLLHRLFSKSSKTEDDANFTPNSSCVTENGTATATNKFKLDWDPVEEATSYLVARTQRRNGKPTYTSYWKRGSNEMSCWEFPLGGGTWDFSVYACGDHGVCGGASEVLTQTVSVPLDLSTQPRNVRYPQQVEPEQAFAIEWDAPEKTEGLTGYKVWGEYRGLLETLPASTTKITRNLSSDWALAPGREYCYKVRALYSDGKLGTPAQSLCVTVDELVLPAPDFLSILGQDPLPRENVAIRFHWAPVAGADYYQLERNFPYGSTTWLPVYADGVTESRQYLSYIEEQVTGDWSNEHFRVSACLADGRCGNYQRLIFSLNDKMAYDWQDDKLATPGCLQVPETVIADEPVSVAWCPPTHPDVSRFDIVNAQGQVLLSQVPANVAKNNQGLYTHSEPAPAVGSQYCYKVATYLTGTNTPYFTPLKCGQVLPRAAGYKTLFIHTDLLGSPVAETLGNGGAK